MQSVKSVLVKAAVAGFVALALGACKSNKTASDSSADGGTGAPSIENTPLSFDAQGSDSGSIQGLQSINFEYDRAALTPEARQKIQGNVEWLKAQPNSGLQIEGHCDARGSIEYNLSLGERRAQAVKNYMVSLGVAGDRLSVISYGKEKPLVMGDTDADYAKNRRANFVPLNR